MMSRNITRGLPAAVPGVEFQRPTSSMNRHLNPEALHALYGLTKISFQCTYHFSKFLIRYVGLQTILLMKIK